MRPLLDGELYSCYSMTEPHAGASMVHGAAVMGLADGPTEVHKVTVGRPVVRDCRPSDDVWPTEWIPRKLDAARAKFDEHLEHDVEDQ